MQLVRLGSTTGSTAATSVPASNQHKDHQLMWLGELLEVLLLRSQLSDEPPYSCQLSGNRVHTHSVAVPAALSTIELLHDFCSCLWPQG